jgi:hypothetical protein
MREQLRIHKTLTQAAEFLVGASHFSSAMMSKESQAFLYETMARIAEHKTRIETQARDFVANLVAERGVADLEVLIDLVDAIECGEADESEIRGNALAIDITLLVRAFGSEAISEWAWAVDLSKEPAVVVATLED